MIAALRGTAPTGMRVRIATRPVDFRHGADGLAATVHSVLPQDPFSLEAGRPAEDAGL
jgi:hypothetical protein